MKIIKTDFEEKFLAMPANGNIFYCTSQMKDALIYHQSGMQSYQIADLLNSKYNKTYTPQLIENKLAELHELSLINKISFKPLFNIFNSEKLSFPNINILTNKYFFWISLITLLLLNYLYYNSLGLVKLSFLEKVYKYLGLFIILIFHEIGHAFFANQYNIKAGSIGLGRYLFLPVFFINLNEIWSLKKEKRMIINMGGIYFQLLIGFLLIISNHFISSNIIMSLIKANFIIALINLNPFIKFDGFWILSDYTERRDLYSNSTRAIKNWLKFKPANFKGTVIYYTVGRILFWFYTFYILIYSFINFIIYLYGHQFI